MTDPDRPVALITGGSRGIGRAVADVLAESHHLLLGGRDPGALTEVCSRLPSAAPFPVDLTDADATASAVSGLEGLDVLVHSAGVHAGGPLADTSREQWRTVLEVNVVAVADLTRMLLPALRSRGGHVVMINSGAGFSAGAGGGLYAASKFALRALTDALREEERGRVRVTAVHPGRVDTDMQRQMHAGRAYDPSEHMRADTVAAAVAAAIRTPSDAVVESVSIRPR